MFDEYYQKQGGYHWEIYEKKTDMLYINHVNKVAAFFKDKKGKLLDVGSGDGLILSKINRINGLICAGIDNSKEAINIAHKKGVFNCHILEICNVKAMLGQFNYIFLGDTLEHIVDYKTALKDIYELLKPDGILYFASPIKKAGLDIHYFSKEDCDKFLSKYFIIESFEKTDRNFYYICRKKL